MEGEYSPKNCGDQQANRADTDLLAGSTPRRGGVHESATPTILSPAAGPSRSRGEDSLKDDQREPLAYSTLQQSGGRSTNPPGGSNAENFASWFDMEMEKLRLEREELEVRKRELALREISFRQKEAERKKVTDECEASMPRRRDGGAAEGHRHDSAGRAMAPEPSCVGQQTTFPSPTIYRDYAEWRNAIDRSYQLGHPPRISQARYSDATGVGPNGGASQFTTRRGFDVTALNESQRAAREATSRDLPRFSGAAKEWPLFISSYESSTELCGFSEQENLLRLQKALCGEALEAVDHYLVLPTGLSLAMKTLRKQFGRPELIVEDLIEKVRRMPAPQQERVDTVQRFGLAVRKLCATIELSELYGYMYNVALLNELVSRLPPSMFTNWAVFKHTRDKVNLTDFGNWIGELADAIAGARVHSFGSGEPERKVDERRQPFAHAHPSTSYGRNNSSVGRNASGRVCAVCKAVCNSLESCRRFRHLNVHDRWNVIRTENLCRKCLRQHSNACHVKAPCGINGCGYMHHDLLHDPARHEAAPTPLAPRCNAHATESVDVLLRYVPVTIHGRDKIIQTFAFLDDGSSATFVEHDLVRELGLEGQHRPLCLKWTGGIRREEPDSMQVPLQISSLSGKTFRISKAHTVASLALPAQSVCVTEMLSRYEHLRGLPLASYDRARPKLLIGMDNCHLGREQNVAEGRVDEPIAANTRLGWIVYGPCAIASPSAERNEYISFHICPCDKDEDRMMDAEPKKFFALESSGISANVTLISADEDRRSLMMLERETRLVGSRYETGLLWKDDNIRLPNNEALALSRYQCLKRKMVKKEELAAAIIGKMREMMSDCGTNFIGAARELKHALEELDTNHIAETFTTPEMEWKYNPPSGPHVGGCWERLIRSIKKVLSEINMPRLPTDEILYTALTEIKMIINSRPLTYLPLEDESATPLTPNHFLLGSSNGSKPPGQFDDSAAVLRRSWKTSQRYADLFWQKWVSEYLPTITRRTKWFQPVKPVREGDIVLIADGNLPRSCWPRGRVLKVVVAKDGQVRRASVQTARGVLERPATKIAVLDVRGKYLPENEEREFNQ